MWRGMSTLKKGKYQHFMLKEIMGSRRQLPIPDWRVSKTMRLYSRTRSDRRASA